MRGEIGVLMDVRDLPREAFAQCTLRMRIVHPERLSVALVL